MKKKSCSFGQSNFGIETKDNFRIKRFMEVHEQIMEVKFP